MIECGLFEELAEMIQTKILDDDTTTLQLLISTIMFLCVTVNGKKKAANTPFLIDNVLSCVSSRDTVTAQYAVRAVYLIVEYPEAKNILLTR